MEIYAFNSEVELAHGREFANSRKLSSDGDMLRPRLMSARHARNKTAVAQFLKSRGAVTRSPEIVLDHFASLFDRSLDAVVGMDHRGNVIAWNKAAEEMFGWSRDEAFGRPMGDLIVPQQHRSNHTKGLSRYNKTREGPVLEQRLKLTAINRSEFEFPIELSIFPMRQSGGDIFYAFIRSLLHEEARQTEQERRAQEADVLLRVAKNLMEDISLEEFTRLCLEAVCDVAGLDAAHVFYIAGVGEARRLVPSGSWFISDPKFQAVADDTAARTFEQGRGLPGQAWSYGEVAIVKNISKRNDFIRRESFSSVGLTQGIAVPIFQDDDIFAVMEFFGSEKARIDEEMIRLLRTVAYQIGLAIRRKREAEERDILRKELAHRVGNSLAILNAMLRGTASKSSTVAEFVSTFSVRLHAVSQSYTSISRPNEQQTLRSLLDGALDLLPNSEHAHVSVPDLAVASDGVLPLSLAFSELVTNHLKHGDPGSVGTVIVSAEWDPSASYIRIVWKEPRSTKSESSSSGYGSVLLKSMIETHLSGTLNRSFGHQGFSAEIVLPNAIFGGGRRRE